MGIATAIIDSREYDWVKKLTFDCPAVTVALLDAGDLLAVCDDGEILAIERKTASDFLKTLKDGRLFPQLKALREVTRWCYLVICGDLRPGPNGYAWADEGGGGIRQTGWTWESVQGALVTAQEVGVHVVFTDGILGYEETVKRLANRKHDVLRVEPAREIALLSMEEAILAALPGIGAERAKALLEHCGTPA